MIRFILSGYADKEMVLRSIGPTHRFLSKPCDPDLLKKEIEHSFELKKIVDNEAIRELVKGITKLPTLPELYQKLTDALRSENCNAGQISKIIQQDVSMSAKVLHLVNSSFFGLRHDVDSIEQAVSLLGIETLSNIVLTAGVLDTFSDKDVSTFKITSLYEHSFQVGALAGQIVKELGADRKITDHAILAGMTHDFGKLVMIKGQHPQWKDVYQKSVAEKSPIYKLEKEIIGVTHAEVGAYLLALWGVSDPVVEALAYHHAPSECLNKELSSLTGVYLANLFTVESTTNELPDYDWNYLNQVDIDETKLEFLKSKFQFALTGE